MGCSEVPNVDSDIDIALGQHPKYSIESVLADLVKKGEIRILQHLHYEVPYGYYYILAAPQGVSDTALHLDCLFDPYGINRYAIPTTKLVSERVREPWGYRASDRNLAMYFLIKRAVKGNIDKTSLEILQLYFAPGSWVIGAQEVERWFGNGAVQIVDTLSRIQNPSEAADILRKLGSMFSKTYRRSHPIRFLLSMAWASVRLIGRLLRPTGTFVVLLGPDGSGKSTLARAVEARLARVFRRVWHFHWRPGLLPKPGSKDVAAKSGTRTSPPREAAYGTFASTLRYLYYLIDFVLGYWLVVYLKKAQTTLVIGERWYYDVITNPARYGFRLPMWLLKLGGYLVPKPDRVVLITADPALIRHRKDELTVDEIAEQLRIFRDLLPSSPRGVEVANQGTLDDSAKVICDSILEATAERTAKRMEIEGRDVWTGFGIGRDLKVWIHQADSVRNAIRLYNPSSRKGRMVKAVAKYTPAIFSRELLSRGKPSREESGRLEAHSRIIREHLCDQSAIVSFSLGTPGFHQKLTAQASRDDRVLAYVKVATEAIGGLLVNEESAINHIPNWTIRMNIAVPQSLGLVRANGFAYLFLSPPKVHAVCRGIAVDDLDLRFLLSGIPAQPHRMDVNEVLSWPGAPLDSSPPTTNRVGGSLWWDAEDQVRNMLGSEGVGVGPCHGDYAPWNTYRLEDGTLYAFDWEYSFDEAPLLLDLFHRVLMPERLVFSRKPRAIVDRLLRIRNDRYLGEVVECAGVKEEELPAYLLLYLLALRRRKSDDTVFGDFLGECTRLVLMRIGRPGYCRRVLVSAYACEPDKGSEPGVGWNWVKAISKDNEAWVITKANNKQGIEARLAAEPDPRLHFEYVELPGWLSFWKKGQRGVRTYYYLWQFFALRRAIRLDRNIGFDLGHHVTFVNDWIWTFLALTRLPFVWGPIGSNPRIPNHLFGGKEKLFNSVRYAFQAIVRLIDPLYWLSALRANQIFCINREVANSFPLRWLARNKTIVEPAIGVEELPVHVAADHRDCFSVLFVGRFIPIKGPMLAFESFAEFAKEAPAARLTMIGAGPEGPKLSAKIAGLGFSDRVALVDWMSREAVLREYPKHDVFLFPSFEGGGMVILEALGSGLPVVCLDYGGPGIMVDSNTGIKIPVGSRSSVITGLADALRRFYIGKQNTKPSSISAIRKYSIDSFSWARKSEIVSETYRNVLNKSLCKTSI